MFRSGGKLVNNRVKVGLIGLAGLCIPLVTRLVLGPDFVTLDGLRQHALLFHALLTAPLLIGVSLVIGAVAPRLVSINLAIIVALWVVLEVVVGLSYGEPDYSMGDPEPLVQ